MTRSPEPATRPAGGRRGSPWRAAGALLVALMCLLGSAMIGAGMAAEPLRPPQPGPVPAPRVPAPRESPEPGPAGTTGPLEPGPVGLDRSRPTQIEIPKIGVKAKIMTLGRADDGTVEVPPLEQAHLAGWYEPGPSPGEIGNAVVLGHVDSYAIGPAVFFELGVLKPGDTINITRKDGKVARFVVSGVGSYPKTAFPSELVYGPSDRPGLRLVTCGGEFDEEEHSYLNNIIVFATLDRTPRG